SPGELGKAATLLYLSGLESVEAGTVELLHGVLRTRKYRDARGNVWSIAEDLWIVAALTYAVEHPRVTPSHWLISGFGRRLLIEAPRNAADLVTISEGMLAEVGATAALSPDFLDHLGRLALGRDNLFSLRRWLHDVGLGATGGSSVNVD